MILCEPFTVFQEKKKKTEHSQHKRKEKQKQSTHNGGGAMVEVEQWWSFNAICTHNRNRALTTRLCDRFFFLVAATGNNGGGAANRDKRRDKGLNTKRRERALTIETDYSQHQHVNVIFFFCSGSNLEQWWRRSSKRRDKGLNSKRRERESDVFFCWVQRYVLNAINKE